MVSAKKMNTTGKPFGKVLIITDGKTEKYPGMLSFKDTSIEVYDIRGADEAVQGCGVDLILLDCSVDIEEGIKILKENKMCCPNIPNIFITAASHEGVVLRAFRAGARDFFRKPVNIAELQGTVEKLLSLRKSCREKRSPFMSTLN